MEEMNILGVRIQLVPLQYMFSNVLESGGSLHGGDAGSDLIQVVGRGQFLCSMFSHSVSAFPTQFGIPTASLKSHSKYFCIAAVV